MALYFISVFTKYSLSFISTDAEESVANFFTIFFLYHEQKITIAICVQYGKYKVLHTHITT